MGYLETYYLWSASEMGGSLVGLSLNLWDLMLSPDIDSVRIELNSRTCSFCHRVVLVVETSPAPQSDLVSEVL